MARILLLLLVLLPATVPNARSLYKYHGADGEWIYADRPPAKAQLVEIRSVSAGRTDGGFKVIQSLTGHSVQLRAVNQYFAPVEVKLHLDTVRGVEFPDPDLKGIWVVHSRDDEVLLDLAIRSADGPPDVKYNYEYLAGDPAAKHKPPAPYRLPFAISKSFKVTQAYPDKETHTTPDSLYAIDISMPVGTNIFAARAGIVFDVASDNFRGGIDRERDGPNANIVQILHDDGTYAIYAHLSWNSIRVKAGQRVTRGQYIADSGNTGFTSGPHLHFAVVYNAGKHIQSVPLVFQGANGQTVTAVTGGIVTAYP